MSALAHHMNDHLGGSVTGVGLAEHLRDSHRTQPLGELATRLVEEIEEDQEELKAMISALGDSPSTLKQLGGWFGDRVAVLLKARGDDDHSRLSLLEMLSLGIEGKAMLWRALQAVERPELDRDRLAELERRAERQRSELEPFRLEAMRALAQD